MSILSHKLSVAGHREYLLFAFHKVDIYDINWTRLVPGIDRAVLS